MAPKDFAQSDPLADPEIAFEHPSDLANSPRFNIHEKQDALMRWEDLVRRRLAAGWEGMPTYGTATRDAELMQEIGKTLLDLEHRRGIVEMVRRRACARALARGERPPNPGRELSASLHRWRFGPFDDPTRRPS